MGETSAHMILVHNLVRWITDFILEGDSSSMLVDLPEWPPQRKPPAVYGFGPDVYVSSSLSHCLVIGEAKTCADVDNKHTFGQIAAFLRKCSEAENSVFVFAVPWYRSRLALSVVEDCKRRAGLQTVRTIVLDRLPG